MKNDLEIKVGEIRAPIKAVCFTCPFWDFDGKKIISALLKVYKARNMFSASYDGQFVFE